MLILSLFGIILKIAFGFHIQLLEMDSLILGYYDVILIVCLAFCDAWDSRGRG